MSRLPSAFFFLIAAWFCANQPQAGMRAMVDWFQSAANPSHQKTMVSELRMKLAQAEVEDSAMPRVASTPDDVPPRPAAPVATGIDFSRLDLAMADRAGVFPPLVSRWSAGDSSLRWDGGFREPPITVPRAGRA